MKRPIILLIAFIFLLTACAQAEPDQPLVVKDFWARPGLNGQNSAIYFTIQNPAGKADKLLSAATEVAQSTELHMSMMNAEGVMSMIEQEFIEVPANSTVEFKPGGLHVMLVGLEQDLPAGANLSLRLQFENAGEIQLDVPVKEMP